ncbi:MAG: regulatory iron-sulfur-containing complex subunit RicT [Cloacibacillus sp.]
MNKYLAIYGKPRYIGLVEYDGDIKKGSSIIVESVRGEELAVVVGQVDTRQETEYRLLRNASEHGDGMVKNSEPVVTDLAFISFATDEDSKMADDYRDEEKDILLEAKKILKPHNLDMKLIDVEFLRAKRKLFFYFSSEQRVDFRAYVRDLAREFKTRIELRQVGVRDEAKIIKGVGPCGQPCCCSYWLNQFAPICIKMVKEQNLALNPAKISGICGRLMCCMCYEYEVYHEAWEGFPNPGSKIKTPTGNVIVSGIELPTKSLRCYIPGKGEVIVPKDRFEEFKATMTSGGEWIVPEEAVEEQGLKMDDIFPKCMQRTPGDGRKCCCEAKQAQSEEKGAKNNDAPRQNQRREDGRDHQQKKRRKHTGKHEHRDGAQVQTQTQAAEAQPPRQKQQQQPAQEENRPPKETKNAPEKQKRTFQRRRKPSQQKPAAATEA